MSVTTWGWLILAFPLAGSILIGLLYRVLPAKAAGAIGTLAIGARVRLRDRRAARRCSATRPRSASTRTRSTTTRGAAGIPFDLGIFVDQLSIFMALVVTGVSMLIHLYSFAYMGGDAGYRRFFSYLNFFVFSMLLLVLAGNYVLLIVGWAFVGYASYALISFWYRRKTATAGRHEGLRDQRDRRHRPRLRGDPADQGARRQRLHVGLREGAARHFTTNEWTIVAICLLLMVGAFAKSAQVPFHTWLADAMEGPTPVSALIHAATMVTAGVYLIGRSYPLFDLAPTAADIAAFIGLATLLMAATIALVVTDLKRIIAFSTMSQIGYMIVGVSIGAYSAGFFHLMTHAFFKALLFMAAGSIISAMARDPGHRPDARLPQGDAVHLRGADLRRARARRLPGHLRLLQQGRDPLVRRDPRRHVLDLRRRRLHRRDPHRLLLVPDRLPGRLRRAVRGGEGARGRPHRTTPIRSTRRPARPRTTRSASPARSTTSPSASGR